MNYIGTSATVMAVMMGLVGCSANKPRPEPVDNTARFVNAAMDTTIRSVDESLKTLVILSRGDESPRKPGALADTVAGSNPPIPPRPAPLAAVVSTPAKNPNSATVSPDLPSATSSSVAAADLSLDTRLRLEWTGSVVSLLSKLSNTLNYSLQTLGPDLSDMKVSVKFEDATVRQVLEAVSRSIEGKADIRVDTVHRKMELVRRGY